MVEGFYFCFSSQALDKALTARGVALSELVKIVEALGSSIESHGPDLDYESKCLLKYCHAQEQLLAVFTEIQRLHQTNQETTAEKTEENSLEVK